METLNELARQSTEKIRIYGTTVQGVGFRNEASQPIRFGALARIVDVNLAGEDISINDLGCGYGALLRYFDEHVPVPVSRYHGYDLSAEMLEAARQFIADERAILEQSPRVTAVADYSFVSGTFNHRPGASDEEWTAYIEETLLNLAEYSRRGFAFNMLTTYVDWKADELYYADPFHFFDFCKRNISRYVSLHHDYPLFEWTMLVHVEPRVP